ncbi:ribonuclease III [Desulfobacter hydrogenophilus]|uniref:Ribonuclease 3 n=1 Tax=Desulfobacter hydrogenophilus TaxID=2291 RepID=A0A328F6Y8_9BACT|nr:ribonuclease III [Desulfobacter hydrogenophilus]NDY74011.1 ribonuclease III [Desulfobacter hydrogenophilus]QBH12724.1 ribonuclease III [Desulfobacter hydrogenophilus]RAM00298.1 ribonuclease III [Desulfobacter hydrogenophilus]
MIDLHTHSTASDGSLTPRQLLDLAKDSGIEAVALTDHDTIAGILEIKDIVHSYPLEFITGVEISCTPPPEFKSLGSIHMLGYGFSVYDCGLNDALARAAEARANRNPQIIAKLNGLGIDITLDEVKKRFDTRQIGRPHIAELLVEKGYVSDFRKAFDLYLGKNKPAYVDKFKISCKEAIRLILDAGGLPVLAHPGIIDFQQPHDLDTFVNMLVNNGLAGIEVYYAGHDSAFRKHLSDIVNSKGLVATGGSDFHGSFNKGVDLGRGRGDLNVDMCVFKSLNDRLQEIQAISRLDLLEQNLDYRFQSRSFLSNALCHRSYLNENQDICDADNERLEFLGDAVLGLCVGHLLMEKDPLKNEGDLSRLRSNLVSETGLAHIARRIDLGRFIKLGKGESLSGGRDKNSILSDAFEAVVAAVYLDAGFDRAQTMVNRLFDKPVQQVLASSDFIDYKSGLQEFTQEHFGRTPDYTLAQEKGPDHDKTFEICLNLDTVATMGTGKTKKAAEQDAARKALTLLNRNLE